MSKEIDIYYQKLYKKYKKKYLSLKNQNAGANNIYFIIKLKESNKFEIFSNYYSTFILKNKNIYARGYNNYGQLGLGDEDKRDTFTKVSTLPDNKVAKQVIVGYHHTMILAEDGTVFACGDNEDGQLGLRDTTNRKTFTEVKVFMFTAVNPLPDSKVTTCLVVAGNYHTMILAEDGTVFACGLNFSGQLGLGHTNKWNTFTAVAPLPKGKVAKEVVAGGFHTMILAEDGTVFACGDNGNGQLGLGDYVDRNTFTTVPTLPDGKVVKQVVPGGNHTMILAEDDTVFACGLNFSGQLGLGDYVNQNTFTAVPPLPDGKVVKQVVPGGDHTMILAEDGTVFACGNNNKGQLGLNDGEKRNTFTIVSSLTGVKVAKQVFAGYEHTIIIAEDNTVFGCGSNEDGQLGLENVEKINKFTEINLNDLN
jgi:alpha-tubulin suppressor-like RCC1 family protein